MPTLAEWREETIKITRCWHWSKHTIGWTNGVLSIHPVRSKKGTTYTISHVRSGCAVKTNIPNLDEARTLAFRLDSYTSISWFLDEPWSGWNEGHPEADYDCKGEPVQRVLSNIPQEVEEVLSL